MNGAATGPISRVFPRDRERAYAELRYRGTEQALEAAERKERKDLASVLRCLRHSREDDDARYGLEHEGKLVPFEFTTACLLGLDARPFVPSVATSIRALLDHFDSPDAAIVGLVATEDRRVLIEESDRLEVFDLFRWFRLAGGL